MASQGSGASVKLAQAKIMGGIGGILLAISFAPFIGGPLGIVGLILILVAVKYVSDEVGDASMFNNILYAVIIGIVGFLIAIAAVFLMFIGFASGGVPHPGLWGIPMGSMGLVPFPMAWFFSPLIIAFFLIPFWIVAVLSAIFLKRGLDAMASHLNVGLFATAALINLIGAVLIVVFFVGSILIFIANILLAVAFFSMPDRVPVSDPGG